MLARGLSVDGLAVDGNPLAAVSDAGRWLLTLAGDEAHEITVHYHGVIAGGGSDDVGPVIDPAGTFLIGDGWYPTFDADAVSYELTVEVPAGQLAVAPGKILFEESTENRYTARFASEGPMEEIALFAGPYRMRERRYHGRRLRTYFDATVADLDVSYLEKTAHYIDSYATWIGAYPYSGFTLVSGQPPLGLGFPGLTYVGTTVLRLPFLLDTSLGHEVLHSWWGNAVRVDVSRGNWAEGLTTFMADYTYEERKGEAQAGEMRRRWMREYAALPPTREQPLAAFRSRRHTASQVVGYHKAAMVFLMLRDDLGRPAFDDGIRRFWARNRFGRASWQDVQHAFEATAGPRRGKTGAGHSPPTFFSQWIERAGAPVLAMRDVAVRKLDRSFVLSFVLTQPEPAYQLRVPIVMRHGRQRTVEAVRLTELSRRYDIRTTYRPDGFCVDPDFRLFRRPLPGEVPVILRSVVFDTESTAVIATQDSQAWTAARALAAQLLEREPRFGEAQAPLPDGAVMLVGTDADVAAVLRRQALEDPPARLAGQGTARAWATGRAGKGALVVVSGRDATALRDLTAPLPHYGGESFVVFDGRRTIDRGVWPADASPLCADLPSEGER